MDGDSEAFFGSSGGRNSSMQFAKCPLELLQYSASFYLKYLSTWPDMCAAVTSPREEKITAYSKAALPFRAC